MLKKMLITIGVMTIAISAPCLAIEIEGVVFADKITLEKDVLSLKGVAVLKWAMLFDVYVGAFYLPSSIGGSRWAEDIPKRLEISYFRDIEAKGFAEASDKILRENLSAKEYESLVARLRVFYGFFKDVNSGDRYSINYTPEKGTELRLNERSMGTVKGADFAAAYFGIWLGEKPIDIKFRNQLLGGR